MGRLRQAWNAIRGQDYEKRIAELEAYAAEQNRTIRDMDQLIFNMSQLQSWADMRPLFNGLKAGCMYRKDLESKRISGLITKEMERAYVP